MLSLSKKHLQKIYSTNKKNRPMTKNSKTNKRDLYQEVTNKMIILLEKGVAPWRCTWNKYGLARNYATGHIYTGINAFLMKRLLLNIR